MVFSEALKDGRISLEQLLQYLEEIQSEKDREGKENIMEIIGREKFTADIVFLLASIIRNRLSSAVSVRVYYKGGDVYLPEDRKEEVAKIVLEALLPEKAID